ncbi:MAG TPA: DUF333 domain-containing protein [Candidatus Methanoperedens sp.]|nr:DUF333 domain-containing protein [Candidatus Methanoperedens sp.]
MRGTLYTVFPLPFTSVVSEIASSPFEATIILNQSIVLGVNSSTLSRKSSYANKKLVGNIYYIKIYVEVKEMNKQYRIIFAVSVIALFVVGVGVAIPNPASKYCVEQGYNNTIRTNPDGSQTGYCIFPNGTECEEWSFFRGECKFGATNLTNNITDVNETNENETNATEIAIEAGNATGMPVNTTVVPATPSGTTSEPTIPVSTTKPISGFGIVMATVVVISTIHIFGRRR